MITIFHLITSLGSGGAERMLVRIAGSGDGRRFQHVVVSLTDEGTQGAVLRERGVEVMALGMRRGVPDVRALLRLRAVLSRRRPNVLQTWMYHADLLGLIAGRLSGIPVVGWNIRCANMQLEQYSLLTRTVRRLLAWVSPLVSYAIVNSKAGKEFHERLGFRPRRWELIFNGFDLNEFKPDPEARVALRKELGLDPGTGVVGMMARFDPMKDFETFLGAAAKIRAGRQPLHFILAGEGVDTTNEHLAEFVRRLDLTDNVHLLGYRSDVNRLMAACDIVTLCSHGEGFPNVIGEAMSCGTPCISSDVGDASFLIGDAGTIVPPRDVDALVAGWQSLLDLDAGERARLGERARRRIEEKFNLMSVVAQYEAAWEGIVVERR